MSYSKGRILLAAGTALAMTLGLGACGGSSQSSANDKEIDFWDPYPQHTSGSDWDNFVKKCAPEGYTIKRQGLPQNDVLNNLTTSVKEDNAPDVVILDNPFMPTAVDAGLVTDITKNGVSSEGFDENIIGPGIVDGVEYGVPFGSNALGLYYNPEILKKAGVDPSSIKDWDSLNAAIKKVVDSGNKGIVFSGIKGEEGVFQYLPWFWGAGGNLKNVDSAAMTDANNLLSSWIKNGWAPKSVTTDNQSASWDKFLTGEYGFAENGSWWWPSAKDKGYEMVAIPSKDGGIAPVATGGEFMTLPYHKTENADKAKASAAVINCLISDDTLLKTNDTLGYLAGKKTVRDEQVANDETLKPWADVVSRAQGRTTDVGLDYEDISSQLSQGEQTALNEQ
ncbi:MAG: extracellular solute-binding protein [Bifidobacteriaceae bacterium]|jgi:multiple sugar transport system substrate-binding protein|nr:extracellular solute-binding protein [Bifidobacteriaceae bacterium]MCI1978936.1 extracellular solute-binding protein [Bifidobacteriaceae bacterium]